MSFTKSTRVSFTKSKRAKTNRKRFTFETLEPRTLLDGLPILSEFMAVNDSTLVDEDNDDSDWIEIQHPGAESFDLTGWYLTDDADELDKWQFPSTTLDVGEYFVVFASGKDRAIAGSQLHTNFKLSGDGEYLALVAPDGQTIASEFAPTFPRQIEDISYGIGEDVRIESLVTADGSGKIWVPADDSLGSGWTGEDDAFDDDSWLDVQGGIGFESATASTPTDLPPNSQPFYYAPHGPGGTYNLYEYVAAPASFGDANADAISRTIGGTAGRLVSIGSGSENSLMRLIAFRAGGSVWTGLTDDAAFPGTQEAGDTSLSPLPTAGSAPNSTQRGFGFAWTSGEPLTYQNWDGAEPNDGGGGEDQVQLERTGRWSDVSSDAGILLPYVIEYPLNLAAIPGDEPSAPVEGDGQFQVVEISGAGVMSTIESAVALLDAGNGDVFEYNSPVINLFDPDTNASNHFDSDIPFASDTPGDDNDFALRANAIVNIPTSGLWTFGVMSDDGFRLTIEGATFSSSTGSGTTSAGEVLEHAGPRGPADSLGVVNLSAGSYPIELVWYERGGGAMVELFAAQGAKTAFDSTFRLVGDAEGGGLSLSTFRHLIDTDIRETLHTVNSAVYYRTPFEVEEAESVDQLRLSMRYDDGFVAYLNGQEIARRNAPDQIAWNSSATAERDNQSAVLFEVIGVSAAALKTGQNVLAIVGLNLNKDDSDFLLSAELEAVSVLGVGERYFATATPGAINDSGFFGVVDTVEFDRPHGFYESSFVVSVTTGTADAEIRYTTDGSQPTAGNGLPYTGPVTVAGTTTLRAAAFKPGFQASEVFTQTYLFLDDVLGQTGAGFPTSWGSVGSDYPMDPNVVNDPRYRDRIRDDLLSLPTMSLVTDTEGMFGSSGIYSNPGGRGISWERATSVEFFYPKDHPDYREGFQVNAGIRIQGGASRNAGHRKHSLRLLFKGIYGPTKLDYPLFEGSPVQRFDTITLRANFNDGLLTAASRAQYIRDQWVRNTQLDMGQVASRGNFVHLYINGLYWGLYNPSERPAASFAASYYGGDKEEWDALVTQQVTDGNIEAWNTARNIAATDLSIDANYEQLKQYIDLPNLIDYMIANLYGGNQDWPHNNWYAARRRGEGETFKFFAWDAERTLEGDTVDRSDANHPNSPALFYQAARANPEFRLLVADRVQKHFFNGGALTPEAAIARYEALAQEVDGAIVTESARWGDTRGSLAFTYDNQWVPERDRILNQHMPVRSDIVLQQFRNDGLYPDVEAPKFSQFGGAFDAGFQLEMTIAESQTFTNTPLLESGSAARILVPSDGSLAATWTQPGFNDFAGWTTGTTGVGYERGSGYEALIATDVENQMFGLQTSVYVRSEFSWNGTDTFDRLSLRMKFDDGFVAYLNGVEVARRFAPSPVAWDSASSGGNGDAAAVVFQDFDITQFADLLLTGTNVLAIQGLNVSQSSSDMLIVPELIAQTVETTTTAAPIWYTTDGSDPRLAGGPISPTAVQYSGPIELTGSTLIRSRTLLDGQWSALNEAPFSVNLSDLRVTEIMFNPQAPPAGVPFVSGDYEFVELMNIGTDTLDLGGVQFTDGIDFVFDGDTTTIEPGQRLLVVSNREAFLTRYETPEDIVIGEFTGQLNNGGERLTLSGALGEELIDFRYNDNWYEITDGEGFSLTVIDPTVAVGQLGDPVTWRPSQFEDGSPGELDQGVLPGSIVISEILTNTVLLAGDRIELFNTSSDAVDLGNWYLSDSAIDLRKYQFPSPSIIAGGARMVLEERTDFGQIGNPGVITPFALSLAGGQLRLTSGEADGRLGGYRESFAFSGADLETPFGQFTNSTGDVDFVALTASTFGTVNAPPRVGPVVINEVMYNPSDGTEEYIELRNITNTPVALFDEANPDNTWQFIDGIEFAFPTGAEIPAAGLALVVPVDPAQFRSAFAVPAAVPIFGPYTGKLANGGERIDLYKPGEPQADGVVPVILVDRLDYDDRSPWPLLPDGAGPSLSRLDAEEFGNDVLNWGVSTSGGTAGAANRFFDVTPPTAPVGLSAEVINIGRIDLSWSEATDPETGIASYQVLRDGLLLGSTLETQYVDAGLPTGQTFGYEVRAVNGDGVASSDGVSLDVTFVGIRSAVSRLTTQVAVTFTEPVSSATAQNISNYSIEGVSVFGAVLEADGQTVRLFTSAVTEGVFYRLSIEDVEGISGNVVPQGTETLFTFGESGFVVRMADVGGGTDGQVNSTTEAVNILEGNFAAGAYVFASDDTIIAPYVNFGGNGNRTTPPVLAYPNGLIGSGGDAAREQFAIGATAVVTIPVGTWSIDIGSDDGGRVLLEGVTFASRYGQNGNSPNDEVRYEAARGHGHTGGVFTVSGSPLVTTLDLVMFEQGGGDSVELTIASGSQNAFNDSFEILEDGLFGWQVKTQAASDSQPPFVVDVAVSGSNWASTLVGGLAGGVYSIPKGSSQLDPLPWDSLDQIQIRFSEDVIVDAGQLRVVNANLDDLTSTGGVAAFEYDDTNFTATWTLAEPIQTNDSLTVTLEDGVVNSEQTEPLDGEWITSVSQFSGDGQPGGDLVFRFNVSPGDVAGDGGFSRRDLTASLSHQASSIGSERYDVRFDIDGDGRVGLLDLAKLNSRSDSPSPAAPAALTDEVFSEAGAIGPTSILGRRSSTLSSTRTTVSRQMDQTSRRSRQLGAVDDAHSNVTLLQHVRSRTNKPPLNRSRRTRQPDFEGVIQQS